MPSSRDLIASANSPVANARESLPGEAVRESKIRFQGVKLYHFSHTAGAIITSIEQLPLAVLLSEHGPSIETWAKEQGLTGWHTDTQQLFAGWSALALKAWCIDSAIGFTGFVVAASAT